jgi:superfamily II DNA or RNA helicase
MAGSRAENAQLVVAGVQTLGTKNNKRLAQLRPEDFEAVVIDEAHHSCSITYRNVINHFNIFNDKSRLLLGVTATPNRADGVGLGAIFDEIVEDISLPAAIRDGWLVDIKGIRIRTSSTLDGVHTLAGDFHLAELSNNINNAARNDLIARTWLQHGQNRQTLIFAVDVQHALDLTNVFQKHGVAAEAVWGDDPLRQEKVAKHRRKELQVLTNVAVLGEGFNDWQISCIGMARPTKSEGLFCQQVGRSTRIPDGMNNLVQARAAGQPITKKDSIVLDFVDGSSKHKLVTLASLLGLGTDTDLKGRSIVEVLDEVEAIKVRKPTLDVEELKDADKLEAYAEEVDLFKISYPPEIIQISEYQWYRTGHNHYVLLLSGKESVSVITDLLEKWHVSGMCNGTPIRESKYTFDEAIKYADAKVKELAGWGVMNLISRTAKWHDNPPSSGQLTLCRTLKIAVPPDASCGDVSKRINAYIASKKRISA